MSKKYEITEVVNNVPADLKPEQAMENWSEGDRKTIWNISAKGTTQSEFKVLLYQAMKYGVDPLSKEIYAIKYGNNPASIFIGRDGFLKIAHRSGTFDGMETRVIKKDGTEALICDFQDLYGAVCRVYRKDIKLPFEVAVKLSEYNTGKRNWAKIPETMIKKVAESQALKKAFSITGVYSPEEAGVIEESQSKITEEYVEVDGELEQTEPKEEEEITYATPEIESKPSLDPKYIRTIKAKTNDLGLSEKQYREWLMRVFNVESCKDLTRKQALEAIDMLDADIKIKQINDMKQDRVVLTDPEDTDPIREKEEVIEAEVIADSDLPADDLTIDQLKDKVAELGEELHWEKKETAGFIKDVVGKNLSEFVKEDWVKAVEALEKLVEEGDDIPF